MAEIELTDANFKQEVMDYDGVAIVDFHAAWCAPCKAFGPTFDEFASELADGVKACKADVDNCQSGAGAAGVMSVPTIAFFKNGQLVEKLMGNQPKEALTQKLAEISA